MGRVILAAIVGAVIYYVWQMLAWMVLPIHGPTVAALPDENAVRALLTSQDLDTGVYIVPFGDGESMADPESEFTKNHQAGPIFSIFYTAEGSEPMPPDLMLKGFLNDLAAALVVSWMLLCASGCCQSYVGRVLYVTGFGVFLALTAHVSYMIWMRFPQDYTMMFVIDAVVGWFLAGLGIAAIVKPSAQPKSGD